MKDKKRQIYSGRWYELRNYISCCDCGLCHYFEYKVHITKDKKAIIYFRCWRDEKRTRENRKKPQLCVKMDKRFEKEWY